MHIEQPTSTDRIATAIMGIAAIIILIIDMWEMATFRVSGYSGTTFFKISLVMALLLIVLYIIIPLIGLITTIISDVKKKVLTKIVRFSRVRNIIQLYLDIYNKSAAKVSLLGWVLRIVINPVYFGIILALSVLVNKSINPILFVAIALIIVSVILKITSKLEDKFGYDQDALEEISDTIGDYIWNNCETIINCKTNSPKKVAIAILNMPLVIILGIIVWPITEWFTGYLEIQWRRPTIEILDKIGDSYYIDTAIGGKLIASEEIMNSIIYNSKYDIPGYIPTSRYTDSAYTNEKTAQEKAKISKFKLLGAEIETLPNRYYANEITLAKLRDTLHIFIPNNWFMIPYHGIFDTTDINKVVIHGGESLVSLNNIRINFSVFKIDTLDIGNLKTHNVIYWDKAFSRMNNNIIGFDKLDTSNMKTARRLFEDSTIDYLDLTNFKVLEETNIEKMFHRIQSKEITLFKSIDSCKNKEEIFDKDSNITLRNSNGETVDIMQYTTN